MLFNIFMWAVVVKWHGAVKDIPGIGFEFMTHDGDCNLYRKTRRTDPVVAVTESQFADDSSLFAHTVFSPLNVHVSITSMSPIVVHVECGSKI